MFHVNYSFSYIWIDSLSVFSVFLVPCLVPSRVFLCWRFVKSTKGLESELTTTAVKSDQYISSKKSPRQSFEIIVLILHICFDCSFLSCVWRYLTQKRADFVPTNPVNSISTNWSTVSDIMISCYLENSFLHFFGSNIPGKRKLYEVASIDG